VTIAFDDTMQYRGRPWLRFKPTPAQLHGLIRHVRCRELVWLRFAGWVLDEKLAALV
jgi:hypothetical protein